MDEYVDQVGDLSKKDFKHKDIGDIKDTVLKELGIHTDKITQITEDRKVGWKGT
jgi:hypothetical protein